MILAGLMCGIATFYGVGDGFHGQTTASGKSFNAYGLTCGY